MKTSTLKFYCTYVLAILILLLCQITLLAQSTKISYVTKEHENLKITIDTTYTQLKNIEHFKKQGGGILLMAHVLKHRIKITESIVSKIKSDTLWMDSATSAKYRFIKREYEAAKDIEEAGIQNFVPRYTGQ